MGEHKPHYIIIVDSSLLDFVFLSYFSLSFLEGKYRKKPVKKVTALNGHLVKAYLCEVKAKVKTLHSF